MSPWWSATLTMWARVHAVDAILGAAVIVAFMIWLEVRK